GRAAGGGPRGNGGRAPGKPRGGGVPGCRRWRGTRETKARMRQSCFCFSLPGAPQVGCRPTSRDNCGSPRRIMGGAIPDRMILLSAPLCRAVVSIPVFGGAAALGGRERACECTVYTSADAD